MSLLRVTPLGLEFGDFSLKGFSIVAEGKHPRNGIRGAIRPTRARQASSMSHHVCGAEGGWFGLSGRG